MKILATALIAATAGFVLALALIDLPRAATSTAEPSLPPVVFKAPEEAQAPESSDDEEPLTYDGIFAYTSVFEQQYYAHVLAAGADFESLAEMTTRAQQSDDVFVRQNLGGIFVERMVQIDGSRALSFVQGLGSSEAWYTAHVFTSWARNDPEPALEALDALSAGAIKSEVRRRLLADVVLRDQGVLAAVEAGLNPQERAQADLARMNTMRADEAFEAALQLPPRQRRQALYAAMGRWYADDPDTLLTRISSLANARERLQLQQWVIGRLGQHDFDAAMQYARQIDRHSQLAGSLIRHLAQSDPERALQQAQTIGASGRRQDLTASVLATWVTQDPDAALGYVESTNLSSRELNSVAHAYARVRPVEAATWALGLGPDFRDAQRSALTTAVSLDHEMAGRLLGQIEDPDLRKHLQIRAANAKAEYDPDAALEWISGFEREPHYQELHEHVLMNLAQREPQRAALMIAEAPDAPAAQRVLPRLANVWARADPEAAETWVRTLPDTKGRAGAFASLVYSVSGHNFEHALDLAGEIADPSQRYSAALHLAQVDPSRLTAIAAELDLPDTFVDDARANGQNQGVRIEATR